MIIENQILTIKWSRATKKYYEQKGYLFTKMNDEFEIDIKDLHEGSAMKVKFICDYCFGKNQITEESKYRPYRNLLRPRKGVNKKDSCNNKDCIRMRILETENIQGIPKGKSLQDRFPVIASQWDYSKNEKRPYDYRFASTKEVWWKCENGHEWKATVSHRSSGKGCPKCAESKGEKRVKEWICKNNIKNISQYSYDDLLGIGGSPLRFDFAVFDKNDNLYKLIEYDGEFHFKKQYYNDSYDKIVEHDKRKNEYCKINNIPLLRIPYWDFDRIEEILESELILENETTLI